MITKVVYARLYNLGNYENERLEVEVTVEDTSAAAVEGAWEDARAAVEEQHVRLQDQRDQTARRQQEEYEAQRAQERTEREAIRAVRGGTQATADGGDLAF